MKPWTALQGTARHLPRDTRDTLFHLAVLAWACTPHLLHLPLWCGAMTVLLLLWRGRLAWVGGALPGRWMILTLLLLAAGLTFWGERTLLGKEAGITMLVVLMALKTLELRARRDALVVFFLGFFLVLTNFLYSQSLLTGLWLLASVWGLLTALALAHMPVGRPPLSRAAAVAGRSALLGLPLMMLLFVLFPRIGPLWGLPQDAAGRTGLSGTLRLGGVASLAEDEAIALRLRILSGPVPSPEQMYFRGPVLSTFDGREWTRLVPNFSASQRPRLELEVSGQPTAYEMTLEPSKLPLLPLLELTPDNPADAPSAEGWLITLRNDAQWQLERPVNERLQVRARAWPEHRHGPRREVPGLRDLLELPPRTNPRTLQWAAELRQRPGLEQADARALSNAVLQHIRTGEYSYTLEPGPYGTTSNDAIDEFWLDRKLGFCEHFASAYVVVMRALGVPARIVTGYQGTDPATQDGYYVVRQRNAHAWAEIWVAGSGWLRVDPTAAVAPDRINAGRSLAPPPGLVAGAINTINPALADQLRRSWEVLNNRWNQWVLSYARKQQFDLMKALGVEAPSWQDLARLLILLLCALALSGAAWAWWDRRRQDPWQRLQQRVVQRLQTLGVAVAAHHPPRERAARVRVVLGPRGEAVATLLDDLDRSRYASPGPARGPDRAWWQRFSRACAALR